MPINNFFTNKMLPPVDSKEDLMYNYGILGEKVFG